MLRKRALEIIRRYEKAVVRYNLLGAHPDKGTEISLKYEAQKEAMVRRLMSIPNVKNKQKKLDEPIDNAAPVEVGSLPPDKDETRPTIVFTQESFERFQEEYKRCRLANEEVFQFEGHDIFIGWARYVIELQEEFWHLKDDE